MSEQAKLVIDGDHDVVKIDGAAGEPSAKVLDEVFGPEDEPSPDVAPGSKPEPDAEQVSETEPPKAEEKPQDEEFDSAFQVLLAAGVPPSVLKNASKSDLVKWSQKQAKREADIQLAMQERADLKKQLAGPAKQTTDKPEPSSGVPTGASDLTAAIKPLVDVYGEDMQKPLEAFAQGLMAAIEAKYAPVIEGLTSSAGSGDELLVERARERLGDRFPKLADDSEFEKVMAKTIALAQTGAYREAAPTRLGRLMAAMEDASGLIFRDQGEPERARKAEVNKSRDQGQPIAKTSRQAPRAQSKDDKSWQAFNLAEDGDEDAARRLMARR